MARRDAASGLKLRLATGDRGLRAAHGAGGADSFGVPTAQREDVRQALRGVRLQEQAIEADEACVRVTRLDHDSL